MWNRKKKRIAELEEHLQDALENLTNVTVVFPEPVRMSFAQVGVRKGIWYRAEVKFMVSDTGQSISSLGLYDISSEPFTRPYFDGSFPPPPVTDENAFY